MKRKVLIVLASGGLLWGLLFALQFTLAGYIVVGTCGTEYYRTTAFWRESMENEGDLPPSFHLQFGGCAPKQGTIVPCLLFYSLDKHINMLVDFSVPRDWAGAQYLDLTKLELVLQDGRHEDLVTQPGPVKYVFGKQGGFRTLAEYSTSGSPVRFYFGEHPNARRFMEYNAGQLKHIIQESAEQGQAHFFSTLWPPAEKVTLIAEGTLHRDASQENQQFRQVSTWTISRVRGLRRVSLP
jgi:hypothetical protein